MLELSTHIPIGVSKEAFVPVPLAFPEREKFPATVVTFAAVSIFRIVLLFVSVTYKFPEVSIVIPDG